MNTTFNSTIKNRFSLSNLTQLQPAASAEAHEEFLLAEFEALREHGRDATQLQEARLNTYLLIVGGGVSALATVAQSKETLGDYLYLAPFVLVLLAVCIIAFGVITFERMIVRSAEVALTGMGMHAIRTLFVQRSPVTAGATLMAAFHPQSLVALSVFPPQRDFWRGLPQIVAILNSFMITLFVVVAFRESMGQPTEWVIWVGITVFVGTFLLHCHRFRSRVRELEDWLAQQMQDWQLRTRV